MLYVGQDWKRAQAQVGAAQAFGLARERGRVGAFSNLSPAGSLDLGQAVVVPDRNREEGWRDGGGASEGRSTNPSAKIAEFIKLQKVNLFRFRTCNSERKSLLLSTYETAGTKKGKPTIILGG